MNLRRVAWTLAMSLLAVPAWSLEPAAPPPSADINSHVVVRLKPATGARAAASSSAVLGVRSLQQIHERFAISKAERLLPEPGGTADRHALHDLWIVETPEGTDIDSLLAAYRSAPEVMYAERDRMLSLFTVNDSLYAWQWALHNTGQAHPAIIREPGSGNDQLITDSGVVGADIHADPVLADPPPPGDPPIVAIVDTGVDPNHPELAGLMWRNPREIAANGIDDDHNGYVDDANGWDHSGDVFRVPPMNNGDANPADYHGHGTHCAGIVAARANNARGIAGVAGECRIMAVKLFPLALTSIAARALAYAVDNGADVISMSWGGPWRSQVLEDAVNYALTSGVVLCAAAGNEGDDQPFYPAADPGVIAVGATDHADRVTSFSSFGDHLALVAPGLDIVSLRAAGTDMYAPAEPVIHKIGNGYYLASGTSMAAPLVAGAVARLRGVSPGLVSARARELLERSAVDLVDPLGNGDTLPGRDDHSGAGRLDLAGLMALAPMEAADISSPPPHELAVGVVPVSGTAFSDRDLSYVLEYGLGASPVTWSPVTEASARVRNSLLGEWSTAGLDGLYTLRLRVGDSNVSEVRLYASNSRLATISSPTPGDSVVSWVDLFGSASDSQFRAYLIELGEGATPASWTVIQVGTQPVVNGLLTSWQGGGRADGWYSLRLRLISDSGEVAGDTVSFYLQSTFSTPRAWKVPLSTAGAALVANFGELDADAPMDIVVATSDGVRAFDPSGQVDGAMQDRLARVGACSTPVAIGDTDGDGREDLVAVNDSGVIWIFPSSEQVRAVRTRERPYAALFMVSFDEFILPTLFLKDIDGDNRDEIHYFPGDRPRDPQSYWVYRSNGMPPLEISHQRFTDRQDFVEYFPADLDGDGQDELYVAREHLYRLNHSGLVEDSVALVDSTGGTSHARTCSALDIDSDGRLELVIMAVTNTLPSKHVLFVFEGDLTPKPGWPRSTDIEDEWAPSDVMFCDTDGDGHKEYFISWYDLELGRISAWRPDGLPLSGHSTYSVWTSSIDPAKLRSPVAADLNADGRADLISCATEDMYLTFPVERIIAWDQLGRTLPGWPVILESGVKLMGSGRRQTTACGDVDRDGNTDLLMVTSENNLVFINVPGATFDSATPRVEFWRYNRSLDNTLPVAGQLLVESVTPTRLQAAVPADAPIQLGFNLPLEGAQDFLTLLEVTGNESGIHTGNTLYDPARKRLKFIPHTAFLDGETVSVRVAKHTRSESGSTLALDFQTSFMVGALAPQVLAPYPAPGARDVDRGTHLSFGLTAAIDPETLSDTTLEVMGSEHGPYTGVLEYDTLSGVAVFRPQEVFAPAEVITARVRPGLVSTRGIVNDTSFTWSFTIAWPRVQHSIPAPFAPGAPRSSYVSVTLDGPLPEYSVNDSALWVYAGTAGRRAGAVTFVASTRSLRFTPSEAFRLGERVTAIAPALNRAWTFGINSMGGPIKFTSPTMYATQAPPRLITAGDLDGDGVVELVAGRSESPYAYVMRRTSGGSWSVDSVLTGGSVSQALLLDLDGDFDLDLVTVDKIGQSLEILRNLGAGRLSPPAVQPVSAVLDCAVHDFNADGHLDLYSTSMAINSVMVLLGQGNGTFVAAPGVALPRVLNTAVAFDMQGDGRADLATGDLSGNIALFRGDGTGAFALETAWTVGIGVRHLTACDVDRDGDADLAVLTDGALSIWRNDVGVFGLDTLYAVHPGSTRAQCADLDADARFDLIVAQGAAQSVLVLHGDAGGRFARAAEVMFPDSVWSVEIADVDADGDLDLAAGGGRSVGIAYYGSGSAVDDEPVAVLPGQFELSQNYPNPFNPTTEFALAVPEPAHVTLEVFNVLGRRVVVLKNEVLAAGYYTVSWDGRADDGATLPSGVYFYRLNSGHVTLTRRMLMLK